MTRNGTVSAIAVLCGSWAMAGGVAQAQLGDILMAPKTLFDRAIEARSASDIATDNRIVVDVNAVMAKLGTISASTTVYEQRLLITGLFDDRAVYDRFETGVRAVTGVKKLYWHARYASPEGQKKAKANGRMRSWDEVLVLQKKGEARLIGTAGVADVNFRVAADASGALYLMGRARSKGELRKALARLRDGDKVRKVVNYAVIRP